MERGASKIDEMFKSDLGETPKSMSSLAFPVDTTKELQALMDEYQRTMQPIPVSFRDIVPWSFWWLNAGLALMIFTSLLPICLFQFKLHLAAVSSVAVWKQH